jgi:hypothetical protein
MVAWGGIEPPTRGFSKKVSGRPLSALTCIHKEVSPPNERVPNFFPNSGVGGSPMRCKRLLVSVLWLGQSQTEPDRTGLPCAFASERSLLAHRHSSESPRPLCDVK